MNKKIFKKTYLDYFFELENKILNLGKYVYLSKKNFKVYSYETMILLQLICSEIDVLAKVIIKEKGTESKDFNINKWGYWLQQNYDKDELYIELLFNEEITIIPFNEKWKYHEKVNKKNKKTIALVDGGKNMEWWTAYNKVKHERTSIAEEDMTNFEKANLSNVINSFGALYILENFLNVIVGYNDQIDSKLISLNNN